VPDFKLTKPHTAKVYKVLKNILQAKTKINKEIQRWSLDWSKALITPTRCPERKRSWRGRRRWNPCRRRLPGPTMSIVHSTSRESTACFIASDWKASYLRVVERPTLSTLGHSWMLPERDWPLSPRQATTRRTTHQARYKLPEKNATKDAVKFFWQSMA
jgi:hypothetical protein